VSRAAAAREFSIGAQLPDDLPGANDAVRMLFAGRDAEALEVTDGNEVVHLLPWAARHGGIAGYRRDAETFDVRPAEFTVTDVQELLDDRPPREVALTSTPASVLTPRERGPPVSWHARCRWGERIYPSPDPAPDIRQSWENGVQIGVPRGYGRYDPDRNVVICYTGRTCDEPDRVTTVYTLDAAGDVHDLGVDHLQQCDLCGELWNPQKADVCQRCRARPHVRNCPRLPPGGESA